MVLIAYLLQQNKPWEDSKLRIIRLIENEAGVEQSKEYIEKLLYDARMEGEAKIVVSGEPPGKVIPIVSENTSLVMFGMGQPVAGEEEIFMERLDSLTSKLQRVLIVKSTGARDAKV